MQRATKGFGSSRSRPLLSHPVEDLREKLIKKRQINQNSISPTPPPAPPPDPDYNFLKDPLRGDCIQEQKSQQKKVTFAKPIEGKRNHKSNCPWQISRKTPSYEESSFSNPYRHEAEDGQKQKRITSERIHVNIKIVLEKSKRICVIDEGKTIELAKEKKTYHLRDVANQYKEIKENALLESCCLHLKKTIK